MAFEHQPGFGSLFKNKNKKKPNHPDYDGEVNIDGAMFKLAGWIKQGKKGTFLSLSVKPKEERRESDDPSF